MAAERAKRMDLKKRLLGLIPTYGRYKIEEGMREWDRGIRDEAVTYLTKSEEVLNDVLGVAVSKRDREMIAAIEESRRDVHTLKERIKTQAYGYFPRFSEIKINREALGKMLDVDDEILDHASKLSASLEAKRNNLAMEESFDPYEVKRALQPIGELVMERERISRTGLVEE
jgi:cobyrinic acid a,c-diamide synthase